MASTDMRDLLRLMGEQLQPLDVEELKHILQDSLSGEFTRCSENMQQIYWRKSMPKYNFNKLALQCY